MEEEESKENGKEIKSTMQSSEAMQQSCNGGQGNCLFPVNKEEEEEEEENEEKKMEEENKQQEEEDKIRTTMPSSLAVQQSCTLGPRQCFSFQ